MELNNLSQNLKFEILKHLPYNDVLFITNQDFWRKYWENYNKNHPIKRGHFSPNPEQKFVLNLIEKKRNVLINSPAGTGKSELLKFYHRNNCSTTVGLTSTTGISALNIGGSTLHSFLGIGLGKENVKELCVKICKRPQKHSIWKNLKTLIIDEVSMLDPSLFEKLEKVARHLRQNQNRFGGIQLIFSGDLFQLPCVSQYSTLITESKKFLECVDDVVELRNILRQSDPKFKKILNKIRIGKVDHEVEEELSKRFINWSNNGSLEAFESIKPTKLFCLRKSVDHINEKELDKLARRNFTFNEYKMNFVQVTKNNSAFNFAVTNFMKNSTTPSLLQLCKNTQVMLTFNLPQTKNDQLVNGSRGIVRDFTKDNFPIVEFINGVIEVIRPLNISIDCCETLETLGIVIQIPLKVAFALTIHSCQGSTLDYASIDLGDCFEFGQAYTALSRVRTLKGLFLKEFDFGIIQAHPRALAYSKSVENNR